MSLDFLEILDILYESLQQPWFSVSFFLEHQLLQTIVSQSSVQTGMHQVTGMNILYLTGRETLLNGA